MLCCIGKVRKDRILTQKLFMRLDSEILSGSSEYKSKFFYCPKCNGVPNIQITKKNDGTISCSCYELDAFIYDERGKLPMEELTRFHKYTIPLEKFIGEIYRSKKFPICDMNTKHGPTAADIYCSECNVFYCNCCYKEHSKFAKAHKTFVSDVFLVTKVPTGISLN